MQDDKIKKQNIAWEVLKFGVLFFNFEVWNIINLGLKVYYFESSMVCEIEM